MALMGIRLNKNKTEDAKIRYSVLKKLVFKSKMVIKENIILEKYKLAPKRLVNLLESFKLNNLLKTPQKSVWEIVVNIGKKAKPVKTA